MKTLYSRKQFLRGAFCRGLRALVGWIDQEDSCPGEAGAGSLPSHHTIAPDFSPVLLRQEAQRLGLDPDAFDREKLLKAVYEAMAEKHRAIANNHSHPP